MGLKNEVIICAACEGKGIIEWEELVDYHKVEYTRRRKECENCKGSGRLLKITKTEYIPYEEKK